MCIQITFPRIVKTKQATESVRAYAGMRSVCIFWDAQHGAYTYMCDCVYVMTRLLKDRLCIKMTFMHNGCWVDYYEKCSRH